MQSNEVAMTAEYAVKQSAATSDYATKAIASRLKMLAEKRKQIFNEDQYEKRVQPVAITANN